MGSVGMKQSIFIVDDDDDDDCCHALGKMAWSEIQPAFSENDGENRPQ